MLHPKDFILPRKFDVHFYKMCLDVSIKTHITKEASYINN